jgi:hypothetical protein
MDDPQPDQTTKSHTSPASGDSTDPMHPAGSATAGRDAVGRFAAGNTASLVVGARSTAFWAAQEGARRAIEVEVINDAGFIPDDAPEALKLAVEALAQATLIARSAFHRIDEEGGPLTTKGRGRRAFVAWQQAVDRQDRALRLLGLQRKPRPVDPMAAVRQAIVEANR